MTFVQIISSIFIMARYTPIQRAAIYTNFIENNRSVVLTQRVFHRRYPDQSVPTGQTIRRIATRFQEHGTTSDARNTIELRAVRNSETIARVRDSVAEEPETSTRRRATQLHISRRSLQRILV
jgi:hypothetical protein